MLLLSFFFFFFFAPEIIRFGHYFCCWWQRRRRRWLFELKLDVGNFLKLASGSGAEATTTIGFGARCCCFCRDTFSCASTCKRCKLERKLFVRWLAGRMPKLHLEARTRIIILASFPCTASLLGHQRRLRRRLAMQKYASQAED